MKSHDRDVVVSALKHAAPYIRLYMKKIFVLKAGGEVFTSEEATRHLLEQVALLHQVGIRVVLVHGAGAGFEVEFATLAGETLAVVTVPADSVRPVGDNEIAHVRRVA